MVSTIGMVLHYHFATPLRGLLFDFLIDGALTKIINLQQHLSKYRYAHLYHQQLALIS
jgi:hypothetical protein